MGIMPADRELKWQRVFRRFGLSTDKPERDIGDPEEDRPRPEGAEKAKDHKRPSPKK